MTTNHDSTWNAEKLDKNIREELNEPDPVVGEDDGEEDDDGQSLIKRKDYVQYNRLLEQAKKEGRVDGPCKCVYCGMKYLHQEDADDCCEAL